jgi:hypothetical protein
MSAGVFMFESPFSPLSHLLLHGATFFCPPISVYFSSLFGTQSSFRSINHRRTTMASTQSADQVGSQPSEASLPATGDTALPSAQVDTNEDASNSCATCAGPANYRCPTCADGVDMHGKESTTFYCSKGCQRKDWGDTHKLACRLSIDRRKLYRIGFLLQWAFHGERRLTWHADIESVKKIEQAGDNNGPEIVVWCNKNQESSHFAGFPDELLGEEHDKQAVLACAAPGVVVVSGLLEQLLKGMCYPDLSFGYH